MRPTELACPFIRRLQTLSGRGFRGSDGGKMAMEKTPRGPVQGFAAVRAALVAPERGERNLTVSR